MIQHAIIETVSGVRYAGEIKTADIDGMKFIRLDVPPVNGETEYTKLFTHHGIAEITYVSKEVALAAANAYQERPVTAFEIPALKQLDMLSGTRRADEKRRLDEEESEW